MGFTVNQGRLQRIVKAKRLEALAKTHLDKPKYNVYANVFSILYDLDLIHRDCREWNAFLTNTHRPIIRWGDNSLWWHKNVVERKHGRAKT